MKNAKSCGALCCILHVLNFAIVGRVTLGSRKR